MPQGRLSFQTIEAFSRMFDPKLRLDPELHRRAEKHALTLGYSSLEEFVAHLLERELQPLSAEDQAKLDERLKGLGYL